MWGQLAGSTGISLAMVAAAHGLRCFIAMPDDAAIEKSQMLQALGENWCEHKSVSVCYRDGDRTDMHCLLHTA